MVGSEPPRSLVEEAQSRGVPVVKKEWLFDGIEDGEMPDPNASKYSFVAEALFLADVGKSFLTAHLNDNGFVVMKMDKVTSTIAYI